MRGYGHRAVTYSGTMDNAVETVLAQAGDGDAVMTLGAGNVWQAGDRILARLRGDA
jgi:UDP-N-acetylmuramate--alanine ligase